MQALIWSRRGWGLTPASPPATLQQSASSDAPQIAKGILSRESQQTQPFHTAWATSRHQFDFDGEDSRTL